MYYRLKTGYLRPMQSIGHQSQTPSRTTFRIATKANSHAFAARPFANSKGETAGYPMCHELNFGFITLNDNVQYRRMTSSHKELAQ